MAFRVSVLTMAAACLLALPARAEDPPYSKAYETCMDKSGGVTADMIDCMGAEHERWDKQLNASYKQVMEGLSKPRQESLRKAQRAWLAFREANCDFVYDPDGGSMARIEANSCMLRMTAERAVELENFNR